MAFEAIEELSKADGSSKMCRYPPRITRRRRYASRSAQETVQQRLLPAIDRSEGGTVGSVTWDESRHRPPLCTLDSWRYD